jgi:hypothetical protein
MLATSKMRFLKLAFQKTRLFVGCSYHLELHGEQKINMLCDKCAVTSR